MARRENRDRKIAETPLQFSAFGAAYIGSQVRKDYWARKLAEEQRAMEVWGNDI